MRYIKFYEEFRSKKYRMMSLPSLDTDKNKNISIFDQDWFEKLLPNQLEIYSDQKLSKLNKDQSLTELEPNRIVFDKNECTIDSDMVQFSYYYNSMVAVQDGEDHNPNGAILDSEPSFLEFDIHFTRNKRGIKLIVNISYGDQVESEFSIESPNKINIINYNGVNSKYDGETHWGFSKDSIKDLVRFFNAFNHGIMLEESDLSFIDEDRQSYKHIDNNTDHLYNDDSNLIDFENSKNQ